MTLVAYRYRMYPNKAQREYFAKVFGCVRFVYNKMLEDSEKYYEIEGRRLGTNPSSYKDEFPFLREVDSSALSNAKINLDHAYNRFFAKEANRPVYKSKKDRRCTYTTSMFRNNIRIEGSFIRLPKIKLVKINKHRTFTGTIKKATVVKTPSEEYYVVVFVETEVEKLPQLDKKIGIDLGIVNLVTDSNGGVVENVRSYDKYMHKLSRENRRLSRKKKGGNNREKQRLKIARLYRKITDVRMDFLHKVSRRIIDENQIIACENLIINDLMEENPFAKRDIMDSAWSTFVRLLHYKSEWYGRQFVQVDTFYPSSQICSNCGHKNDQIKGVNVKNWVCIKCGAPHQRDINAGKNILQEGERLITQYGDQVNKIVKSKGELFIDITAQ